MVILTLFPIGFFTFHVEDLVEGFPLLWSGLLNTLLIAGVVCVLGFLLGLVLGILRYQRWPLISRLSALYIELIRSIPLILFLVFVHYGVMPLLMARPNLMISSLLAYTLFEAAYVAEIVRGGLRSISPQEHDVAQSMGLTYGQQLRYLFLPLALSRTMPALVGQGISLVKDTSLASIVGVIELTRAGEIIYEQTYHDFEILLVLALTYFAICYALSQLSRRFESQSGGSLSHPLTLAKA